MEYIEIPGIIMFQFFMKFLGENNREYLIYYSPLVISLKKTETYDDMPLMIEKKKYSHTVYKKDRK